MRDRLVVLAWIAGVVVASVATAQTPNGPAAREDGPMPVAEFHAALPADPAEAAVRAARNARFSLDYFAPLNEDSGDMDLFTHPRRRSEKDLVQEADTIVEATVLTAAAHIAQNRKVIYSESVCASRARSKTACCPAINPRWRSAIL